MPHWKTMMEHTWLCAADLQGRDVTVAIEKVVGGVVIGDGGRKSKKPIVHFKGAKLPLALNSTNAKTVAALYGNETEKWVGRLVTLYPTTTEMSGKTVDCVRIRPSIPRGKQDPPPGPGQEEPSDPPPPDERDAGSDG